MNYYQHHIGDYRRDTAHLTLLEHGIYRQLLDTYYLTEQPIPEETEAVYRRLSAKTDEEKRAVETVLSEFFFCENGWHHKRCDAEITAYHTKADTARTNGKLGGRPRKTKPVIKKTTSDILANPEKTGSQANHKPLTINHKPTIAPEWIPVDEWSAYLQMRVQIKKPATERAKKLVIAELEKLKGEGQDVGAVLDQSVRRNWIDVYAVKGHQEAAPPPWAGAK